MFSKGVRFETIKYNYRCGQIWPYLNERFFIQNNVYENELVINYDV